MLIEVIVEYDLEEVDIVDVVVVVAAAVDVVLVIDMIRTLIDSQMVMVITLIHFSPTRKHYIIFL